ncbi:Gfo/Idh/MocA family oxidoreductase [Tropicimonas sp. TH_r6]|uniref:Gfo/Idh/MocA family protein n=1 Tax=Tropicimonas sp. TH_r6 TaxID=3082085 RepID=UPI002953E7B0|nr:Gfo/Idh/MocA family oxidoreductase [Tropicimonas sp. TH_r6]MDV7141556.1 Gfo/Idh/MocA family oxidoreductase [Tropicimonas sp. TH_r6]
MSETVVKLVVAGIGLVGRRHVAAIRQTAGTEIAAVVDPSPEARAYAEDAGLTIYETLEAMFDALSPDGVILSTPTPLHVDQAMLCVARGCPALVEKPLATSAQAAAELVAAAEAAGVPLLVGHHRRHNPLIKKAFELISGGEIGQVRAVQASAWFYKPESYYDVAPWRKAKGAGPISVNLAHDVDLIRHLCGEITSVRAEATPSIRGYENEDVAAAVFRFENDAIGTITVSDAIVAPWSWELTAQEYPIYPRTAESCYLIGGSHGSLSLPDLRIWSHGATRDWWTPISATSLTRDSSDPLLNQIAHFAQVIRGDAAPLVSGLEGLRTLRVIEAIQSAAASGDAVEISRD